jgi:hypothetical protein
LLSFLQQQRRRPLHRQLDLQPVLELEPRVPLAQGREVAAARVQESDREPEAQMVLELAAARERIIHQLRLSFFFHRFQLHHR